MEIVPGGRGEVWSGRLISLQRRFRVGANFLVGLTWGEGKPGVRARCVERFELAADKSARTRF